MNSIKLISSKIIEQGNEKFDSNYDHKQAIMKEASKKLNHNEIQDKVMSMAPEQLADQQGTKIKTLLNSDSKNLEKMKYYDSLLNLERKCNHFNTLMLKLRRKVIHKPFIILDMLKILDDNRSSFDIFMCLYIRLRNTKKRQGFDAIMKFVEHKNDIVDTWVYLAEKLLDREKRSVIKSVKARKKKEKIVKDKSKILKRSLTFLLSVMGNFLRRNLRSGFGSIKYKTEEQKKEELKAQKKFNEENKKRLDIAKPQNFLMQKFEKKKPEPEIKIVEIPVEVPVKINPETFEVVNTGNMFHHVPERRREMNQYLDPESELESQEKQSEISNPVSSKRSLTEKHHEVLKDISKQIVSIKQLIQNTPPNQMLTLNEEIELLSQLTRLIGLLKDYYEYLMENPKFRESKNTKRNFEQVMELIKKIIDRLLGKIEREKKKHDSNNSKRYQSMSEPEKRESLLIIDNFNKNIKKEMEEIANLFDGSIEEEADDDDQIPEENGINNLFQEMLQNLGQMNTQMGQKIVQEEDEENYSDSNTL